MKLKLALAVSIVTSVFSAGTLAAGDPARGEALYATCGACHGPNGQGLRDLNAPALTGLSEWYIVRQLKNFKNGIRGSNPQDVYGMQMAPMAQTLPDEQAMEDVAAYIKTLDGED